MLSAIFHPFWVRLTSPLMMVIWWKCKLECDYYHLYQCSPEALAAGFFTSYLHLKRWLLLLDKTTENFFFFCKTISSEAWMWAWFGSTGYFTILADDFKICGKHWSAFISSHSLYSSLCIPLGTDKDNSFNYQSLLDWPSFP